MSANSANGPQAASTPGSLGTTAAARTILNYVKRAGRRAIVRDLVVAGWDGSVGIAVLALGCAWAAGISLRGDLAAETLLVGSAGICAVLLGTSLARTWRRYGRTHNTARKIANCPAGLSDSHDVQTLQRERWLRHEILGAVELVSNTVTNPTLAHDSYTARSPELVQAYLHDVARRIAPHSPSLALPGPRLALRFAAVTLVGLTMGLSVLTPTGMAGLTLLWTQTDARPQPPPEPVWSSLTLTLTYPSYTQRPERRVPNPSGALRVVAGTQVAVDLIGRRHAASAKVVLNYDADELAAVVAPEVVALSAGEVTDASEVSGDPKTGPRQRWTGTFVAKASGTWSVVLLDGDSGDLQTQRRSVAMPLQLEVDRPPEIELLPLPRAAREVGEHDKVDLRFVARDDFGLSKATLTYQLPDGTSRSLDAGTPISAARSWRHRYTWDIAQIPIAERSEVIYWIEVRDNDPGLGLQPLPDPPGKLARSATMRLVVRDNEAEHAANIVKLIEIRDAAVDLLGLRMTSRAFAESTSSELTLAAPRRLSAARALLGESGRLLAMLATAVDTLAMDTLADTRDIKTLAAVHRRLIQLHRAELTLHEGLPSGIARARPQQAETGLTGLQAHNTKETAQLEDEIIRLDDLVDGEIIERLEALVARLETTQRKLVELLEQLKAGDETARAQIDQLEQRRREDLRRVAEARAMLRREVDEEFMNLDAFKILKEMAEREQLSAMLKRGELDRAIEQAQQQLGDVQQLRDAVQDKVGQVQDAPQAISEEDRKRMELLRELSRLQDEESSIRGQTAQIDKAWREQVAKLEAKPTHRDSAQQQAEGLRKTLEKINDARLGRDGRRGLEDAKDAVEELDLLSKNESASQLDLADATRKLADALGQAQQGAELSESEGKTLKRARTQAKRLASKLQRGLPSPSTALGEEQSARLDELRLRQGGLRTRSQKLLDSELGGELPKTGRKAMRSAAQYMDSSSEQLGRRQPGDARTPQSGAWEAIQEAIDSLRRGPPPPPPSASSGEASTDAERDRSLRDSLMDAMKEGAPQGYAEPVKRYYEELLR